MDNEMIILNDWEAEELSYNEISEFSEVIFAWCGVGCGGHDTKE